MKPEGEWIASKIPIPAIIDKDLFVRTRAQLEANFALCQRNKKNEYLLAGKIQCLCGKRRTGEGPQHGKHLYYRCSDRVASFPLPAICKERGLNARIADRLVWEKISGLMSSPELLTKQIERWMTAQRTRAQSSDGDFVSMQKEISKLRKQEERYNKAYGAGLFSIEQLKEYTDSIRERVSELESQVGKTEQHKQVNANVIPSKVEIKKFADEAVARLINLNFETKRAIVLNTIEKIVGSQQKLQVYGYIPISHVGYKTSDRNRGNAERRQINSF